MSESVRCPKCFARVPAGRMCEQCGAPLPIEAEANVAKSGLAPLSIHEPSTGNGALVEQSPTSSQRAIPLQTAVPQSSDASLVANEEPAVEIDSLCIQFANILGFLRVRFNPGAGSEGCDNVTLTLCDQTTGWRKNVCEESWFNRAREFKLSILPHSPGPVVFDVSLSYEKNGKRTKLSGDWATVSVGKGEERRAAENLVVNITTNITGGHASEIHNSTQARDRIEEVLRGEEDLSDRLREIVSGDARAYVRVDLFNDSPPPLPPQPSRAKTDRLMLDLGTQRILFFSSPAVTFGRRRDWCDIYWRHPNEDRIPANDPAHNDYRKISKRQCFFEHCGESVALFDGSRIPPEDKDPSRYLTAFGTYRTDYGTNFNSERVEDRKLLATDGTGSGLITFSDSAATGMLSVCVPGDVCAKCTRADRRWCANGRRPSLIFKRLDGAPETAVMVWSCFKLEEVAPSFEGVKIFCEDGGFAWRRGRHCGWLVPGESRETGIGLVCVRSLPSPKELGKKKDDVRNQ